MYFAAVAAPEACGCEKYNHVNIARERVACNKTLKDFWLEKNGEASPLAKSMQKNTSINGLQKDLIGAFQQAIAEKFSLPLQVHTLNSRYLGTSDIVNSCELLQEAIVNMACPREVSLIAFWLAVESELIEQGLFEPGKTLPLCPHEIRAWFKDQHNQNAAAKITRLTLTAPMTMIPAELQFLRGLTELHIKGVADLKIPSGRDFDFPKLHTVSIEGFKGEQLAEINRFSTAIKCLQITDAAITAFPQSIITLKCLEKLKVTGCKKLTEIPAGLGLLNNLLELDLSNNAISKWGESDVEKLVNLTSLALSNNPLKKFSAALSRLPKLTHLNLHNIGLTILPDCFFEGRSLRCVDLSGNQLEQFSSEPDAASGLVNLEKLLLQNNRLPTFPESFCSLKNLVELNLEDNRLAGKIPDLKPLEKLQRLFLKGNSKLAEVLQDGVNKSKLSAFTFPEDMLESNYMSGFVMLEAADSLETAEHSPLNHSRQAQQPIAAAYMHKIGEISSTLLSGFWEVYDFVRDVAYMSPEWVGEEDLF